MLKLQRPITTSAELDTLEHNWWNDHSEVIVSVWEMDTAYQNIIRKHYMQDAKKFFSKSGEIKIFEPGCGSGWVGQMIANDNLSIIGTDFSKTQIDLSKQSAANKSLSAYCNYHEMQSNEWPQSAATCDGILLHSFLHHLNGQELDSFFEDIKKSFPSGTKIWMFEPCFYDGKQGDGLSIDWLRSKIERIGQKIVLLANRFLEKRDLLDTETLTKFKTLETDAQKNSYYLSPKEVPFDVVDYRNYLSNYMRIDYEKWAIINLVGWVFYINLTKDKTLRNILGHTVVKLLAAFDRYLCQSEDYAKIRLKAPNHGFRIYAGTLK